MKRRPKRIMASFKAQRGTMYFDFSVDRLLGLLAQTMGKLEDAMVPLRGGPGLLPQGRLPARAGLDLLRLRRRPSREGRSR